MPDRDLFFRTAARGWHRPLRQLCGAAEPAEVARFALSALAKDLRKAGGIPQLIHYVDLLRLVRDGRLSRSAAFERINRIALTGSPVVTRISCRAVAAMMASPSELPRSDSDLPAAVTAGVLGSLVEHQLFGRAEPELAGERFRSEKEFDDFAASCRQAIDSGIASMAQRVVRDPSAASLRAPAMKQSQPLTTAELLDERLD